MQYQLVLNAVGKKKELLAKNECTKLTPQQSTFDSKSTTILLQKAIKFLFFGEDCCDL